MLQSVLQSVIQFVSDRWSIRMTDEEIASAMLEAADGFADDELVWYGGHQWSACMLRDRADAIMGWV